MCLLLVLMLFFNQVKADYYTTASGMKGLLQIEQRFAKTFLEYFRARKNALNQLETVIDEIEGVIPKMTKNVESYVGNPVNSWVLINRFLRHWQNFDRFIVTKNITKDLQEVISANSNLFGFSNEFEIKGAVYAIMKVQETYKVTVETFANRFGSYSHVLQPEEIYEVGRYGVFLSYFHTAQPWLKLALKKFSANPKKYEDKMHELYELLAWCSYQSGDIESAIDYTNNLLEVEPSSKIANYNLWHYKRELIASVSQPSIRKNHRQMHLKSWMKRHDIMCRHEEKIPNKIAKTLFCRFYRPHYRFWIKPLKTEVVSHDPEILVFHDFLLDSEIKLVKRKAENKLDVAKVYSMVDGSMQTAHYRISKNAWLQESDGNFVGRILKRVGAATNLDMNYSEQLQVANYGIGGNYEPHYDFATPPNNASVFGYYGKMGNRIATVLMYLTDVEHGGDTVFTQSTNGVMTSPIRGSAVLWYNLKRNGMGDLRTRHAGCPILLGEKWIANVWIHEFGQEFRRPCSLDPNL